jgi:hypothetical protein|tara:strand:+ start:243 stop:941 length:699 start_codon:yes stop_codon:yes gene_type:complete
MPNDYENPFLKQNTGWEKLRTEILHNNLFKTDTLYAYAKDVRLSYTQEQSIYPRFKEWHKLLSKFPNLPAMKMTLPIEPFKIYRGGSPNGFSWTMDKNIAIWFAGRFAAVYHHEGQKQKAKKLVHPVYEMTVTKDEVLFYYHGRGEHEVVLVPEKCAGKPKLIIKKKDALKRFHEARKKIPIAFSKAIWHDSDGNFNPEGKPEGTLDFKEDLIDEEFIAGIRREMEEEKNMD